VTGEYKGCLWSPSLPCNTQCSVIFCVPCTFSSVCVLAAVLVTVVGGGVQGHLLRSAQEPHSSTNQCSRNTNSAASHMILSLRTTSSAPHLSCACDDFPYAVMTPYKYVHIHIRIVCAYVSIPYISALSVVCPVGVHCSMLLCSHAGCFASLGAAMAGAVHRLPQPIHGGVAKGL